jgi:DNA invertase Pin-like site-specific DNA recombinase
MDFTYVFVYGGGMVKDPDLSAATRQGLEAARARGVRLGRPHRSVPPDVVAQALELRAQGASLQGIADALAARAVPTLTGKGQWTKSSVQYVLRRADEPAVPDAD